MWFPHVQSRLRNTKVSSKVQVRLASMLLHDLPV